MTTVAEGRDEMDDITFCLSDCQRTDCYRHPSNIQDRTIPHSYADFKGTETCPEKIQLSKEDATKGTTFDYIDRQAAMNAFAERVKRSNNSDFAPVPRWNDAVEIVENLPSVQPEHLVKESGNLVKGLVNDCISRKAAIEICNDAVDFWDGTSGVTGIWSVRNEIGYFIAALMFMAGDDDD